MIADPLEAYRRCDPADDRMDDRDDWEVLEPMLRRRLDALGGAGSDDATSRAAVAGSVPRRHRTLLGALSVAALAVGGIVIAMGSAGGDDRAFGIADEPGERARSEDASSSNRTLTTLDRDAGALHALATDALADDFADAINGAALDDALAVLSSESDCDWPQRPDYAEETCAQYWAHQVAIGTDLSFHACDGTRGRRCGLVLRSQLATVMGHPDRSRTGTVRLRLDDDHLLVFAWEEAPATGHVPDADERRLYRAAAEHTTPVVAAVGRPPVHMISEADGPLRLDRWSGEALMAAARDLGPGEESPSAGLQLPADGR